MTEQKLRMPASTGKKSSVGQARKDIYKIVWRKINSAEQCECWLEVITLTESVIADRLEARLAHLANQSTDGRKAMTAAQAAKQLRVSSDTDNQKALELYKAVGDWAKKRNAALHELAKLFESTTEDWQTRYDAAKQIAKEGVTLAISVSELVKKLNSPAKVK